MSGYTLHPCAGLMGRLSPRGVHGFLLTGKGVINLSNTNKQVRRYNEYISLMFPGFGDYEPSNKECVFDNMVLTMLNRTQSMFIWNGLPDTVPQRILEMYLQCNGCCAFYEHENELYVYNGALGGEPDVYFQPTIFTISNPAQHFSVNAKIDVDCVIMRNDSFYMGLLPLHRRYAHNMVETELSMHVANINSRIVSLISAQDDRTRKSAEKYLDDVLAGELGVVSETKFFDDLKTSPFSNSGVHGIITDLIELMQYHKASWYNEIGLNANYNMKRESINSKESQLNNDALLPLVDNMLIERREGAERVNDMFGTSITVDFSSSWKDNIEEIEAEINALEGGKNNDSGTISNRQPKTDTSESDE